MWTVVYLAQGKAEADKIEGVLTGQGILVKLRNIGKDKKNNGLFEVLVPNGETEDACNVLTSMVY